MGLLSQYGKTYQGKWSVKRINPFTSEDVNMCQRAEIVPSEYGKSVHLLLTSGGHKYFPVSNTSKVDAPVGASVDISKCNLVVLGREGSDDIYRIEING